MTLKEHLARFYAQYRVNQINSIVLHPRFHQEKLLTKLITQGQITAFGKEHHFQDIKSYNDFKNAVPIRDYEGLKKYIDRAYEGEPDILWKNKPIYFATTSGTTSGTKYIPLTKESIPNQIKGARDALLMYIHETKKSGFLNGKMIFLSGSPQLDKNPAGIATGRLSGIAQHFVPRYLQKNRMPSYSTNCIEDWEQKLSAIVNETKDADMRLISGIPPWVQMYLERLQQVTGKKPSQQWQNLQLYVQGGVDYSPYKPIIEQVVGKKIDAVEVYPASEGFIAVQNTQTDDSLLLMLDYGIFFELIPMEEYDKEKPTRLPLWEVELNKQYAIILTTNAGLWGYDIGDTVRFTSLKPYKIKVTGRTKHFISAFGEHIIQEEVNQAITAATNATNATIIDFTVAPSIAKNNQSFHEWFIEFQQVPNNLEQFITVLDNSLRSQNHYYDDLRTGNMLLSPVIQPLAPDAVREYMKSIGKLGGQNKFPRLSNNRNIVDKLNVLIMK